MIAESEAKETADANATGTTAREAGPGKHGLTRKEMTELRTLLTDRRRELIADMLYLDSEFRGVYTDSDRSDESECAAEHQEAQFVAGVIRGGWAELREIDDTLARMEDGTYGICRATGRPIGLRRLRARPWAKYCLEYAQALENRRAKRAS